MIFRGFLVFTKPYSSRRFTAEPRAIAESFTKSTWKFTYPPPAAPTLFIRENLEESTALAKRSAKASGFSFNFFASSKQREEASCPNSGFGGLSRAKSSARISGKSVLKADAKLFSHSARNAPKGLSAT